MAETYLMSTRQPTAENPWEAFRQQMPIAERFAYFDHAAVAPLPRTAQAGDHALGR